MITVIGEALIDLVRDADGRYTAHCGGSPFNVAVALARLDEPVSLRARFSRSSFGRQLRAFATDNGVDLSSAVDADEPASLAVVGLGPDGSAEYDFYVTGTADWLWRSGELTSLGGDIVHTGSLASLLAPGATVIEEALRAARARGALITFDPNIRPTLLGIGAAVVAVSAQVERLVGLCHVVKASDQDLAWLYPDEPIEAVVRRWLDRGPGLVVVTQGGAGAFAVTASQTVHRPAPQVAVVDTVGAGDAFMAALLVELARGRRSARSVGEAESSELGELLERAIAVATLACIRAGANPPTRAEVEGALEATRQAVHSDHADQ